MDTLKNLVARSTAYTILYIALIYKSPFQRTN